MTITGMPRPRFGLPEAGKDKIPQLHTYFLSKSWLKRQNSGTSWYYTWYCNVYPRYTHCTYATCTVQYAQNTDYDQATVQVPCVIFILTVETMIQQQYRVIPVHRVDLRQCLCENFLSKLSKFPKGSSPNYS